MNMNKLRGKIVEAGMTHGELASACKMSKSTLSRKITGRQPFDTTEIIAICEALGIHNNDEKVEIFLT